jgi:hypothetical protein
MFGVDHAILITIIIIIIIIIIIVVVITPWLESVNELCRPIERRLSAKLVPTFLDRGCRVVSAGIPTAVIADF